MKWLNTFLHSIHWEKKQSRVATLISANTLGQPVWTPRRFDALTEEGYQQNPIVYRAISLISRGIASVKWNVTLDGHCLSSHPLLTLIQRPNPSQGFPRFMEALTGYYLLSGNAYIEAVGSKEMGQPVELHLLRPDRMKIIPGQDGLPAAYSYSVAGKTRNIQREVNSPVLHIKSFHPLNDWYGMSPLEAAARAIDQHNHVSGHNLSLLQNGARPTGALMYEGLSLTPEQRESIRDQMQNMTSSMGTLGRPLVMEGRFQWKEMGLTPKDLDFIEGKYLSAREIAQAYGIPPMLVGVPGDATFANYREARYHLWEDTILPLLETLKTELNNWLIPHFCESAEPLCLEYDTESISALTPKRETAWAKVAEADFLTVNEKRKAVGYPSLGPKHEKLS